MTGMTDGIIVGSREHGGLAGAASGHSLGSVAGTLVHHSPCPVTVLHSAAG